MMHDMIVLGAGPAGTACAIAAAQRGSRVLILSHSSKVPRPGESLHPGVEPILNQLGIDLTLRKPHFRRYHGICVSWGPPPTFMPFGHDTSGAWRGWQIPGVELDRILLERAARLGVEIIDDMRLVCILRHNERVVGVRTDCGEFFAHFTVDATGRKRWLVRQLGLIEQQASPFLLAKFGYVHGDASLALEEPWLIAEPTGWCWIARVGENKYHWMRLLFSKEQGKELGIPASLSSFASAEKARYADVTWRITLPSAGLGYFLIGDAAWVLDPSSSHGVLKALLSGIRAAEDAQKILLFPSQGKEICQAFTQDSQRWFESDKAAMIAAYQRHPFPPKWVLALNEARQT